jgi:hypothetical protein
MSRTISFSNGDYSVRVYPKNEFGEYVSRLFIRGFKYQPADYFTDDKADAIATAQLMLKRAVEQSKAQP